MNSWEIKQGLDRIHGPMSITYGNPPLESANPVLLFLGFWSVLSRKSPQIIGCACRSPYNLGKTRDNTTLTKGERTGERRGKKRGKEGGTRGERRGGSRRGWRNGKEEGGKKEGGKKEGGNKEGGKKEEGKKEGERKKGEGWQKGERKKGERWKKGEGGGK